MFGWGCDGFVQQAGYLEEVDRLAGVAGGEHRANQPFPLLVQLFLLRPVVPLRLLVGGEFFWCPCPRASWGSMTGV